jgi:hypothetical protein
MKSSFFNTFFLYRIYEWILLQVDAETVQAAWFDNK